MALQALIDHHGLQGPEGYWVIAEFKWDKNEPATIRLTVNGYANAEAYHNGSQTITRELVAIEIPVGNPDSPKTQLLQQISAMLYPLIKAQCPRFTEAIDI